MIEIERTQETTCPQQVVFDSEDSHALRSLVPHYSTVFHRFAPIKAPFMTRFSSVYRPFLSVYFSPSLGKDFQNFVGKTVETEESNGRS